MQFSYKQIPINYCEDTWELLHRMDLCEVDENTKKYRVKRELQAGKYHYPANYNEHISPTNAAFFALVQSSSNVQICDEYMSARYIAKYAAGVESRGYSKTIAGKDENTVKVLSEKIENEKIAGVKRTVEKRRAEGKQKSVCGRLVSITECLWWCLQMPYVSTNVDFVHVCTMPKEYRSGTIIEKKRKNSNSFSCTFNEAKRVRKDLLQLPSYRLMTRHQELLLEDAEQSSINPDKVTVFGLRPPELLFIDKMKEYFSWFVRSKTSRTKSVSSHESLLSKNLGKSHWVDCLGYVVKLRPCAVPEFIKLCKVRCSNDRDRRIKEELLKTVCPKLNSRLDSLFVSGLKTLSDQVAVVVFTNTVPNNPTNFLVHYLLSFGKFITELDLLNVRTFKDAFAAANLIEHRNVTEEVVLRLTKEYLLKQLRFLPGSSKTVDKFLNVAYNVLLEALTENNLFFGAALPSCLDKDISEDYSEAVTVELAADKSKLISYLHTCQDNLPNEQEMLDATRERPISWKPSMQISTDQSKESYLEQSRMLDRIMKTIDEYRDIKRSFTKNQIIVGPPGTGKTFVMLKLLAYALCKGLNCILTSLAAERSAALAGKHLNALIPFPVENNASADFLTKFALNKLQRLPHKSRYLQQLDAIFVEELSMISSEVWAATDLIFQMISSNRIPFGGKLVVATGDFFQLPPPSGTSLMSSCFPLTTFIFHALKHFVRMRNGNGQELLSILSCVPKSLDQIKRAWEIISKSCNFVNTWSAVPNDRIRIFATRKAEKLATIEKIEEVKRRGNEYYESRAIDEMCLSSTENWVTASNPAKTYLNKKCLEPSSLFLFVGAILRLTVNKPSLMAYQGQLCVLIDMKKVEEADQIIVALAPAGCREIPSMAVIKTTWRCVTLKKEVGVNYRLNYKTVCRRIQFPVKLFVASTIHKTMGETLPMVATQIVGSREFCLWLPEQLYVVVSRVRNLSQVTFVGSLRDNEAAIVDLLSKTTQWMRLTREVLDVWCSRDTTVSLAKFSPYTPSSRNLPVHNVGFCYLLQSVPLNSLLYIGSTMNLRRRVAEHNCGAGSHFTSVPNRRPWLVAAYVTGFSAVNASERIRTFEKEWLTNVSKVLNERKQNVNLPIAIKCAERMVKTWRYADDTLKVIVCQT